MFKRNKKIMIFTPAIGFLLMFSVLFFTEPVSAEKLNETVDKPIDLNEIKYDINQNLNEEQISERFHLINSNYQIGETFSPEDTEFIRAYALSTTESSENPDDISTYAIRIGSSRSASFNKSKKKYGVTAKISGKVYSKIGILNNSYRGNFTTIITSGSAKKIKYIRNTVTNAAYGLIGGGGTKIGLVYNGQRKATSGPKKKKWSIDKTAKYTAIGVLYTYTDAYTEVKTTSGTFTLHAF
ncbi:hypothetical protein ACEWET_04700 [Paraliobacillus sp. JSM ZJ581]